MQVRSSPFVWQMVPLLLTDEWRSTITGRGEQCVMTTGTFVMDKLFVDSWALSLPLLYTALLALDKGKVSE